MTAPIILTPRELEVVDVLLQDGAGNQEIADVMGLDLETVKSHMKSAMRKTGMRTRTELVVAILRDRIRLGVEHRLE